MYVTENTANNIRITLHSHRRLLDLLCDPIVSCIEVESICCTAETNLIFYDKYTLIKLKTRRVMGAKGISMLMTLTSSGGDSDKVMRHI